MRITHDVLLNLAKENAARMAESDRSLVCIYLTGSLLEKEPFLGGLTDIDLICVHDRPQAVPRQIIRITEEVHLDVAHQEQSLYDHPSHLRADAWVGGALCSGPVVLHETMHWFDYTLSSVTSQFLQADNVASRAGKFSARARKTWLELSDEVIPQGPKRMQAYLGAINDLCNALACLTGMPLTLRRMGIELPNRLEMLNRTDLLGPLVQTFYGEAVTREKFDAWLPLWREGLISIRALEGAPVSLGRYRTAYYEKAVTALADDRPAAALWLLLRTWSLAALSMPRAEEPYKAWQNVCKELELDTRHMPARLAAMDTLTDSVDDAIETWQRENQ